MPTVTLADPADFDGWRDAARALAQAGVPASAVVWQVGGDTGDLLADAMPPALDTPMFAVPRGFLQLAKAAICHSGPERFALLYALLLKLRDNPRLIEDRADRLVHRLNVMAKEVGRDIHKMRAFVRFREAADAEGERFVAWFEPDHHIVRANAPFFVGRFANMRWSILTPELCVHWDRVALTYTPDLEAFLEKRFGKNIVLRGTVSNLLNRKKREAFRKYDGDSFEEILENRADGDLDEFELERERSGRLFQVTLRAAF